MPMWFADPGSITAGRVLWLFTRAQYDNVHVGIISANPRELVARRRRHVVVDDPDRGCRPRGRTGFSAVLRCAGQAWLPVSCTSTWGDFRRDGSFTMFVGPTLLADHLLR